MVFRSLGVSDYINFMTELGILYIQQELILYILLVTLITIIIILDSNFCFSF
jgi:hypothetical protein